MYNINRWYYFIQAIDQKTCDKIRKTGEGKLMDAETGEFNDAAVYDRLSLAPGAKIEGPAIVTESDTATVITRRFEGQVTDGGYMIFERKNSK